MLVVQGMGSWTADQPVIGRQRPGSQATTPVRGIDRIAGRPTQSDRIPTREVLSSARPAPNAERRPAFSLVRAYVEPPAGIEPATPSLPSMVGPFGGQRGTSLRSIALQVAGLIDDREMGCCEAGCGAAAGKSLARSPVGAGGQRITRQQRTVQRVLACAVLAAQVRCCIQLVRSCHPGCAVVE